MTDWDDHAPKNHMTSLEQWEREWRKTVPHVFGALLRRHSIAVPQTSHLATPTFYGSSGRSRIDFVATHPSVQFSRIFVNFTAGRRLQLIPAAVPRDHMPLTLNLETNGVRHCLHPSRGDGITRTSKKCSQIPLQGSLFSRNWRQKIVTRRSWNLPRQRPLLMTHGKTSCR